MAYKMKIFIGNSTLIELLGLRAQSSGAYINDATVTVTIIDANGTTLTGPTTMAHDGGTNGRYSVTLGAGLAFVENATYVAQVDAVADEGTAKWEQEVRAESRD